MNEFQIIIGISIIFFSGMAVVYSADIKGEVTDLSRINLLCLLLFVCAGAMWVTIDYNETTLPEYQAGYNDYPDNSTYNKIIQLDKIDLDMQHYKHGWERAEIDSVKIEFENEMLESDLLKRHEDLKHTIKIKRCQENEELDETYNVTFYLLNSRYEPEFTRTACLAYGEKYNISFGEHEESIYITDHEYYLFEY